MYELWNGTIKTPYLQFYAVFTITKDSNGVVQLAVETEPMNLNLSFEKVRLEENILLATGLDESGQTYDLELTFQHQTCTGSISLPYMGTVQFSGEKGRGTSLNEKLQKYGEASVQENRYWRGKWIWDVRQPEEQANTEHRLVYFRKSFHIGESISPKLVIDISADSRYRLYVNGKSVSIGPCKGDMHTTYYESVDVSEYLFPGNNVLAVKVLRYPAMEPFKIGEGGPISIWRSQSAGLLVEASLRDENSTELMPLHSDANWRTYRHQGYRHVSKQLIRWMGGIEEVEGNGAPQGWEFPDYDDSSWEHAIPFAETRGFAGILSPWNLLPRPIPFMYEEEKQFVKVTKATGVGVEETERFLQNSLDNTSLLVIPSGHKIQLDLDAGELTTAYLNIRMRNGRGAKVRMMGAECYEPHESTEMQRKKGDREDNTGQLMGEFDTYIVAGQVNETVTDEVYEPFWFRTFRYVRLEIETEDTPLELLQFSYRETRYPLEVKAQFESSDQELNTIWDLSVRTLQLCMHETYEDCPYYEQLQYAMDSRLMMLFTYNVSGDDRMARRTIEDFYRSRQPSGLLQARFPSVEPQVIPSFSLYWVDMISEHFEFNGDLQLVEQYRPAIIELMDWFHTRLTDDGIVGVTSNRYWTYFDWVDAWPLGAPPESVDRPMFLLSFMYAAALRKSATLLHATGWSQAASTMESRAEQVCNALRKLAWSEERQLFRDMPGLEIYSQHTQIISILAGAIEGEEARRLMERTLEEQIHRVTLPFSYLMIQALKKVGLQHKIFGLWDRWRVFASQGLTTLPEMEVNPRSDCHAWSAVPLAEFPATILGVTPADPGATTIRIEPHIGKLDWAKGSVATKQGLIEIEWHIEEHQFLLKAKLPVGTSAIVKLPDGTEQSFRGSEIFSCTISQN
ncbi:family 78 glycoside hydrolase catalytic domain [Paenibacillus sp. 2TAF8]|uniref:alpha-L-rhamnosidase-related protein n=1 Tax=Paenibacillus sp. 2TAF8 TaxID=3233020 RepID=UPI003F9E244A